MLPAKVYLTFDLEEFDIVHEYGSKLPWLQQIDVTLQGMQQIEALLNKHNVAATFFTTAAYAKEQPALVNRLATQHEIASHTFWHSSFEENDLKNSLLVLREISGQQIKGLRMPRMRQVSINLIKAAGYTYDSSINPTRLPGRYNYSHLPKTSYYDDDLLRIPASVSNFMRLPLFWLAFKNYPYPLYLALAKKTLQQNGYLNLYFHPWEFADLSPYKLPWYIKKPCGNKLLKRLDRLLTDLKPHATFHQLQEFSK